MLYELGEYVARNLKHWIHMFEFGRVLEQCFSIENQHIPMIPSNTWMKIATFQWSNIETIHPKCGKPPNNKPTIWGCLHHICGDDLEDGKHHGKHHGKTFKCSMGHQDFFLSPIACKTGSLSWPSHTASDISVDGKMGGETKHDMMMIMAKYYMLFIVIIC